MKSPPDRASLHTVTDLTLVAAELSVEASSAETGHAARTLVREPDLSVVVTAMRPGAVISNHRAMATAVIQVLRGRIRLDMPDRSLELVAGQHIALERALAHEVTAVETSAFIVTLARST